MFCIDFTNNENSLMHIFCSENKSVLKYPFNVYNIKTIIVKHYGRCVYSLSGNEISIITQSMYQDQISECSPSPNKITLFIMTIVQ